MKPFSIKLFSIKPSLVFLSALSLVILCAGAFAQAGEENPAPQAARGARLIAVFPYLAKEGALLPEHGFAAYAVPDMLRVGIATEGRFALCEKDEVEGAFAAAQGDLASPDTSQRSALIRAALALGADHFVWGYLISSGEALSIYQELVETESGRSLHISFTSLPSGPEIFDAAQKSATDFSAWIASDLPLRQTQVLYLDKEVIVERPVRAPSGIELSLGADYRFFFLSFEEWLRPTPRFFFSAKLPPNKKGYALSLAIESSPLLQRAQGIFIAEGITVLHTALLLGASRSFRPHQRLSVNLGAQLGAALFAGYVSPRGVAYLRPEAAINLDLGWNIQAWLSLNLGLHSHLVPYAYGSSPMLDLAPRLSLTFHL